MALHLLALVLIFFGSLVSILFWIPRLVNHAKLREFLGRRYVLVYLFYFTNGPFLVIIGLYLLWFQNH